MNLEPYLTTWRRALLWYFHLWCRNNLIYGIRTFLAFLFRATSFNPVRISRSFLMLSSRVKLDKFLQLGSMDANSEICNQRSSYWWLVKSLSSVEQLTKSVPFLLSAEITFCSKLRPGPADWPLLSRYSWHRGCRTRGAERIPVNKKLQGAPNVQHSALTECIL